MKHPLHELVEEMLLEYGGLYSFQDIVDGIRKGEFQSFALGSSWAVVKVNVYPRKKVLEVLFVVGTIDDEDLLHAEVEGFAREHGCDIMHAVARNGFKEYAKQHGWVKHPVGLFTKDLGYGS